jgi:hypothetical protein
MSTLTDDEAGAEAEFSRGQAAGITGGSLIDAGNLKQHGARIDNGHPELWGTFTLTHPRLWWTCGDGLVWEHTDEDASFTLQVTGDRHTAGFDLVVLDPAALKALKSELTVVDLVTNAGISPAVSALGLAIFYSAGQKGHDGSVAKLGEQKGVILRLLEQALRQRLLLLRLVCHGLGHVRQDHDLDHQVRVRQDHGDLRLGHDHDAHDAHRHLDEGR